ncbi:CDP-diacylglycerol--glycerol-3-phosphate 3-phosphatidyltransferase [Tropicimonas sp. IMCC34043]|uniref:CDP-diacylglycerol--glycerol-3-phosphate 3-phosphatidyltransferase n=1 Tax=Tropicimonas sp. IMCC34043 TaxID=2248760 RepID=UPI000E287C8C|nr:CDP-diacylglycerol--glycerol-3-phosphate 3-phosphatidyltransferase [Tropicimonas sp. IMCC34043]
MTWTLPNVLTVARLIAAPLVLIVFLILPRPLADWAALVLFAGAAATDWIDGYLARAWNQQSKFGTMLDPIADKAMVMIALGMLLAITGPVLWLGLPTAAILFREVFVSGLREFLGDTAGTLKVTKLAKWKTMVQMVAIATLLASGALAAPVLVWIGGALMWLAAALTLMTGWDYFTKALPFLREEPR